MKKPAFGILVLLFSGVMSQGMWEYDYPAMLPSYRYRPAAPLFMPPIMAPQAPVPFHMGQARQNVPLPHRLGSAAYREPRFSPQSRESLFNGNEQPFRPIETPAASGNGDLDSLLARLATKLPQIAGHILGSNPAPTTSTPWQPWESPDSAFRGVEKKEMSVNQNRRPSDVVNSMPDPQGFFTFGKLLSAFTGSSLGSDSKVSTIRSSKTEDQVYDMDKIHGIPIQKDLDSAPEVVAVDEVVMPEQSNEVMPNHESEEGSHEFVDLSNNYVSTTAPEVESTHAPAAPSTPNPSEDLLGSLLTGKLDKIDWVGSIFGADGEKSEPNALSGIFNVGDGLGGLAGLANGLLGSAMDQPKNTVN